MIVISHPWEYVPKGSSHLNYHTNSINNKVEIKNFTASNAAGSENQENTSDADMITEKNRITQNNQYKNIKLELNNSSLTDFSFVYLQKTAPVINNLNFEVQVYQTFYLNFNHLALYRFYFILKAEKWHLKHINDFCENEIFIKENKVILSFGGDDSKIIKRTFTFDSPVIEVKNNQIFKYLIIYVLTLFNFLSATGSILKQTRVIKINLI